MGIIKETGVNDSWVHDCFQHQRDKNNNKTTYKIEDGDNIFNRGMML